MTNFTSFPPDLGRNRILDTKAAAELYGFSVSHFRRLYRNGTVPAPIRISDRKIGWPAGVLIDDIERVSKEAA